MKKFLLICFLLINSIKIILPLTEPDPQPPKPEPDPGPHPGPDPKPGPGPGPDPTNDYNYTFYKAVRINGVINGESISSEEGNESAVYVNETATIIGATIIKESGETSNIEDCEFYGVNAAILVQNGTLTMTGGEILTKVGGSNALVATNHANVTISGTTIKSTATRSARGLHSTYKGKIEATNVNINTQGGSCATLATDRGEGVVICESCTLSTNGSGSPLIYSTGNITVSKTTGISGKAQAVVIEGKNKAIVEQQSLLNCSAGPNRGDIDQCGVMIYQSMSGDASSGTGTFICDDSEIEIYKSSNYYTTAPMFFITNTNAEILLQKCNFTYGSNIFLSAKGTGEWGKEGSNGGDVTLNLTSQNIEGDFIIDNVSSLTINIINSNIKGTINGIATAKSLIINIDKDSTIELTGNSSYTQLINEKSDGTNLINGSYSWNSYTPKPGPEPPVTDSDPPQTDSSYNEVIVNKMFLILLLNIILF